MLLKRMLVAGGRWLSLHRGLLNELNVFPVPDGDTGTNLSLTVRGALSALAAFRSNESVSSVATAAARGALMGARGNSGVIMSQILHGFAKGLSGLEIATVQDFAKAFSCASEFAYKAVQEPREGTILTVIRTMSEKAESMTPNVTDLVEFLTQITNTARKTLLSCYEELPILRDAGVVDAGGLGLVYLYEGMLKIAKGEQLTDIHDVQEYTERLTLPGHDALEADIKFGFCTEFLVHGTDLTPDKVLPILQTMGDSIVLAKTQDILKVHIHTNDVDAVEKLVTAGCARYKRKVENMREQNKRRLEHYKQDITPAQYQASTSEFRGELEIIEPPSPSAVAGSGLPPMAAIVSGDGFCDYLNAWGITVIPGGQTSNPSAQEILEAIKTAHEKSGSDLPVAVFCNNSNCIAAVRQAIELGDIPAQAVETVCPSQMISLLRQPKAYADLAAYTAKLSHGEITQAVRDASVQGQEVRKGDYMAIWNKKLVSVDKTIESAVHNLLAKQTLPDASRLVVIAGDECDPNQTEGILMKISEAFPGIKVEFLWGGQPHYPILVTLE